MKYFRVEIECVRKGKWVALLCDTFETLTAASRSELEAATRRYIEDSRGEKYFEVIWLG